MGGLGGWLGGFGGHTLSRPTCGLGVLCLLNGPLEVGDVDAFFLCFLRWRGRQRGGVVVGHVVSVGAVGLGGVGWVGECMKGAFFFDGEVVGPHLFGETSSQAQPFSTHPPHPHTQHGTQGDARPRERELSFPVFLRVCAGAQAARGSEPPQTHPEAVGESRPPNQSSTTTATSAGKQTTPCAPPPHHPPLP